LYPGIVVFGVEAETAYALAMTTEVRDWLHELRRTDRELAKRVGEDIGTLRRVGPMLGRPLVDRISHSQLHNLKELRTRSSQDIAIRILFVFDPERRAVLLVAGNKAGRWRQWYRDAIPRAESLYADYLKELNS